MDDPPRSQSVLHIRPTHRPGRANRLFSSFKGIIRLPGRKSSKDDNNPYASRHSTDASVKPYMSQPMLGLNPSPGNHYRRGDRDTEEYSEQSVSPDHSPARDEQQNPHTSWRSRDRSFSISNGLVPATQAGLTYGKRGASIDGLSTSRSHTNPLFTATPASKVPDPTTPKKKHQPTVHTPPDNTGSYNKGKPLPPDPSSMQVSHTITTSIPADEEPTPRPLHIQPRFISSASASASSSASSSAPPPTRPGTIAHGPTPIPSGSLAPNSIQRSVNNGTVPQRRTPQAPRLTLPPPNVRFSLSLTDGSARLSPSIIMRPPPLPLLLPVLPPMTLGGSSADPGRQGHGTRAGLQSMPALPRRGTSRGVRAHEEADDGEEEDDDEGEGTDADGHEYHDEDFPRASVDSEASEDVFGDRAPSRSSSYHTAGGDSGEGSHSPPIALPEVDTSRIDLSFLGRPVAAPAKGKGKAREEDSFDPTRTPTSARPVINTRVVQEERNDYFNSRVRDTRPMKDRTPHPTVNYVSSAKTPKQSDAFLLPMPVRTSDFLGLSDRPGMYKRASRSLIDVSAIGVKERVEQIVEEEEQKKVMRRMSRRMKVVEESAETGGSPRIPGLVVVDESDPGTGDLQQQRQKRLSAAPAYDAPSQPLRRRRSMPTFNAASEPPPYPSFAPFQFPKILPREDEGNEHLPPYSNDILLRAIMPRKVEFTSPGMQAKDRKWRRVMCVLEGTAFRVYRCSAGAGGVSALGGWWERQVGVGDVAEDQGMAGTAARAQEAREAEKRKERDQERELIRALKPDEDNDSPWGRGYDQVEVRLPSHRLHPPGGSSSRTSFESRLTSPTPAPAATKSALNLAVNLLKPSKVHHRSNSDAPRITGKPQSPRASLNIPRPSDASGGTSSSSLLVSPNSGRSVSSASMVSTGSSYGRPSSPTSVPATASSSQSHVSSSSRTPNSASSRYKDTGKDREEVPEPHPHDFIKQYSLQNAESGLGNDYIKRKNVIRVRMEGEQFLLQAKDVASVVQWIEGLQAATNVALDLDERPMPRGPLFPRRRRRRRQQASTTAAANDVLVASAPGPAPVAGRT